MKTKKHSNIKKNKYKKGDKVVVFGSVISNAVVTRIVDEHFVEVLENDCINRIEHVANIALEDDYVEIARECRRKECYWSISYKDYMEREIEKLNKKNRTK